MIAQQCEKEKNQQNKFISARPLDGSTEIYAGRVDGTDRQTVGLHARLLHCAFRSA